MGRRPPSVTFVSLGTLTGSYAAERLVNASAYLGGRSGIPGVPVLQIGSFDILEGGPFYGLALAVLALVCLASRLVRGPAQHCPLRLHAPPAMMPCGTVDGLPVGLMLVGAMFAEETIYRAAAAFEGGVEWKGITA